MASAAVKGRWVIVLGDHSAPVFWSEERDSLETVCRHIRRTCPSAHVVWQDLDAARAERALTSAERGLDGQSS